MLELIKNTARSIRDKAGFEPEYGIILGTGLGGLVDLIDIKTAINYSDIPDFPVSTVKGHVGRLIFGMLGGKKVVAMQGRFHYYEGYTPAQVVFPVRVMKFLGIKCLFVSNASGGINPEFGVGDLMVITSHVNTIPNPLIGPNIDELGVRFPDMTDSYDPELIEKATQVAGRLNIPLRYGCYLGLTGPSFETPGEHRYYRSGGVDTIGMSTTPEVIAARHMGIPVFAVSVITNVAFDGNKDTHEDVQKQGEKAGQKMNLLFAELLKEL